MDFLQLFGKMDLHPGLIVLYGVEADRYRGGIVFMTERIGAFFYVLPEALETTYRVMRENGYRPWVGEE